MHSFNKLSGSVDYMKFFAPAVAGSTAWTAAYTNVKMSFKNTEKNNEFLRKIMFQ